jgi:hypothetical protein
MSVVEVETLIIGGGQAGLAMSEHLTKARSPSSHRRAISDCSNAGARKDGILLSPTVRLGMTDFLA